MIEDDKNDDTSCLPTRTGPAQGKSFENRMLSTAVNISTKVRMFDGPDGKTSVLMRTRNGMPEFITTVEQQVQTFEPCVKGHFVEGEIDDRVVYEPNEGDDSNVRVFSSDYLFSRITKLAKKIKGVVAGKKFSFALTQHGEGTVSTAPKLTAPVESGSRTYHPAVIAYEEKADGEGTVTPRGLHFEIHRFKDLKFKFSPQGKVVTYTFANAAGTLPMVTNVGCMNKDAEELGFDPLYRARNEVDRLTEVRLKSKKSDKQILLEFSGGVPEAFDPPAVGEEANRLKVVDDDDNEALDLSKVANYGQAWHGKLTSAGVHTVVDGVPSVVTPKGYIPPTGGDVTYIRSPLAAVREETNPPVTDPLLLAAGAQFKDYALLFGANKRYSTTSDWNVGEDCFVHFDITGFARVFRISTSFNLTSATYTLVYVKPLWDVSPEDDYEKGKVFQPLTVNVLRQGTTARHVLIQNKDGSRVTSIRYAPSTLSNAPFSSVEPLSVVEITVSPALQLSGTLKWVRPTNEEAIISRTLSTGVATVAYTELSPGDPYFQNGYRFKATYTTVINNAESFLYRRDYPCSVWYDTSGTLRIDWLRCEHGRSGGSTYSQGDSYVMGGTTNNSQSTLLGGTWTGNWSGYVEMWIVHDQWLQSSTPITESLRIWHKKDDASLTLLSSSIGTIAYGDPGGGWTMFIGSILPGVKSELVFDSFTNCVANIEARISTLTAKRLFSPGLVQAASPNAYASYNPVTEELAVSDTPIAFS